MNVDLRNYIVPEIRRHPRVSYQKLVAGDQAVKQIATSLPRIPSFHGEYFNALCLVDWDHRLPSQKLTLRLYGYYSKDSYQAGYAALEVRLGEIAKQDLYPEFDVPGFDNLPADEEYEVELGIEGKIGKCKLVSLWRRTIAPSFAAKAVMITEASNQFAVIAANEGDRPSHLGDPEAVSWTPPCESDHATWTIDVWYLLAFDGKVGTGQSFLVDINEQSVVAVRDFSVRTR